MRHAAFRQLSLANAIIRVTIPTAFSRKAKQLINIHRKTISINTFSLVSRPGRF
jgi:hypothetical protein